MVYFLLSYGALFVIRALFWADKSNLLTRTEELRSFELQVMQAHVELNMHMVIHNEIALDKNQHEIEKNSISFLGECENFLRRDDEQNPIKILGFRADWRLFQGVITACAAFIVTFAEFVGLEAFGIELPS